VRVPRSPAPPSALGAAVGRRSTGYGGDWIWPVLVTLVVALLTSVAAVALAAAFDEEEPTLVVATTSQPDEVLTGTVPATTGVAPVPGTVTLPEAVEPPPAPKPPPPPPSRARTPIEWPAGRNGFTVVLASVPQSSRAAATARAKEAIRAGLDQVGVLNSSRYSSLHPGYLVVFSGVHRSLGEAQAASSRARNRGYADAYAAEVAK